MFPLKILETLSQSFEVILAIAVSQGDISHLTFSSMYALTVVIITFCTKLLYIHYL